MTRRKKVIVVQRRLTDYRLPLFEQMREMLAKDNIEFCLLHGDATADELKKNDGGVLDWAHHLPTRYMMNGRLCWQPFGAHLDGADLVVVTQENKLLYNHLLMLSKGNLKVGFWGHGRNLQSSNPSGFKERFKRWTGNRVDWWFAYTQMSVNFVEAYGFPPERITNLENAIDTRGLAALCADVTGAEIDALRLELGLEAGKTALYLGSLYAEKRIEFLLEASRLVSERVPGFTLLIVGSGRQRELVETAVKTMPWIRYLGTKSGSEKARILRSADAIMNPGLVGLGILDSFVAGVPMITTDCGLHSPEIDYLCSSKNGLMVENDMSAYVDAVCRVLLDDTFRSVMAKGALDSGSHYTIENMASKFCDGIAQALAV